MLLNKNACQEKQNVLLSGSGRKARRFKPDAFDTAKKRPVCWPLHLKGIKICCPATDAIRANAFMPLPLLFASGRSSSCDRSGNKQALARANYLRPFQHHFSGNLFLATMACS